MKPRHDEDSVGVLMVPALILMPAYYFLILAAAIITIMLNPALFKAALLFEGRHVETQRMPQTLPSAGAASAASPHAIVVGYGMVGRVVADRLRAGNIPIVIIEDQDQIAAEARAAGIEVLHGNAADAKNLAAARVAGANSMFVAIPNGFEAGQIVQQAKAANARLVVVARAHSQEEFDHLHRLGATRIVLGEREHALAMVAAAAPSTGTAAT